jgi:hypothetical protein
MPDHANGFWMCVFGVSETLGSTLRNVRLKVICLMQFASAVLPGRGVGGKSHFAIARDGNGNTERFSAEKPQAIAKATFHKERTYGYAIALISHSHRSTRRITRSTSRCRSTQAGARMCTA